ncbi:MAG: formate dehydrogenase accessory sulfurtransferase FdhD [Candidatus Bathyarchaeota archaeon]|nr:MAG: formate dehydrogenase accessory sulfurtransferase FdhD [Candidatus Bathyarchaeota archaeon]
MSTVDVKLRRVNLRDESVSEVDDVVTSDRAVCVFINDKFYRTLITTPAMVKELVLGHLLCEGVVESIDDVEALEVDPLKVWVELKNDVDLDLINMGKVDLITTACGSLSAPPREDQLGSLRRAPEVRVEAERIWEMVTELNRRSDLYRSTGGTHSAMLCSLDGTVRAFAEDVGRHNAVDKVVGAGVLGGVDLGRCVLVSSGRQSSEIVLKVARSGIPVIASVAAPLESGVNIAKATGITLVCFVRGRRMNVYTHHGAIVV